MNFRTLYGIVIKSRPCILILFLILIGTCSSSAQEDPAFHAKYAELMETKSAAAQEKLYTEMKADFPGKESEKRKEQYKFMLSNIAATWLREGNLQKYKQYSDKVGDFNILYVLVSFALKTMREEGKFIDLAATVNKSYLDGFSKQKSEGSKDYNVNLHVTYLENYAMIQHKLGNGEQAVRFMEEAATLSKKLSAEFTLQYAMLLTNSKKDLLALNVLADAVKEGRYDQQVVKALERAYYSVNHGSQGYEQYLTSLKDGGYQTTYEEVKKIRSAPKPAPTWTLSDLQGNQVSLESLKGKIVIIDFWATWCGPCKRSFPAMQKAVDAFAGDPDVKFLFISVDVEKDKSKVENYLRESGFRFNVLLSPGQGILKQYGVAGIPAKFIIDPKGNIQFSDIGSTGSDESIVNHIKAMVELVKADNPKKSGK